MAASRISLIAAFPPPLAPHLRHRKDSEGVLNYHSFHGTAQEGRQPTAKGELFMRKPTVLNPRRKLFLLLALLTAFMGSLSFTAKPAHALICCSICDLNPDSAPCRHGCLGC